MEKLDFQDASFLRLESSRHPFHVGGLMILKPPADAPRNYLHKLVARTGRLNEVWPIFNKKLQDPQDLANGVWVVEDNYQPQRHVLHYGLPRPGRMDDLLGLVSRAHERQLDPNRPLWEIHIIEGLPRGRFAVYCKVHHALVDGVGALKMLNALFTTSADAKLDLESLAPVREDHAGRHSLLQDLGDLGRGLMDQYRAIPQLSSLLVHMGMDALRGEQESMKLPFTAPRSIFNTEVSSARKVIVCDLPFTRVRAMARQAGGSINDVLLSICGGALRRYLQPLGSLPRQSLVAGVPVSLKSGEEAEGNKLNFMLCPYFTNEADDLKRLRRVVKTTTRAKAELAAMSTTANQDFMNLIMMPTIILTLSGNSSLITPPINAVFSNVPGSRKKLYMEGAELESLYPLSVVTDAMAINITVVSYANKLCFAITSCPTEQPGVEKLGALLKESYGALRDAMNQGLA